MQVTLGICTPGAGMYGALNLKGYGNSIAYNFTTTKDIKTLLEQKLETMMKNKMT
jgi:hypothetical protein